MNNIKTGMIRILIANIINLFISLLTSFLLPKYLSVDTYANVKTFQLYISFVGLLHLGFIDGIYLRFGGKNLDEIPIEEINQTLSTYRLFQLCMSIICIVLGTVISNPILICFGAFVLPTNMIGYFSYLYQASGEFSNYTRIINCRSILCFIINICLLFIFKTDGYIYYIFASIFVEATIWLLLEKQITGKFKNKIKYSIFNIKELVGNIKSGILLTLGNFASIFLTGMDRWFIKVLLDSSAFAQYSFAVSMENFLNLAVTPLSITLYNYLCREKNTEKIKRTQSYIIVFAVVIISCAFPAKFILEIYLTKYIDSINVLFLLFGAQIFYIIIKSIYINLHKVFRKQKQYFIDLVTIIAIGFVLNAILFFILRSIESFAIGTLLSAVIWFFIAQRHFVEVKASLVERIYIFVELAIYLLCGYFFNSIVGFSVYIVLTFVLSLILMNKPTKELIGMGKNYIYRLIRRQGQ